VVARRAEIYWADLGPPANRRPVCVLTRDAAIGVLATVTCAPITRTVRGIRSEVEVGAEQGLSEASAINCDGLITVYQAALDPQPVGRLDQVKWAELDRALRYALDIRY
jgi:mRNA interferase MazF